MLPKISMVPTLSFSFQAAKTPQSHHPFHLFKLLLRILHFIRVAWLTKKVWTQKTMKRESFQVYIIVWCVRARDPWGMGKHTCVCVCSKWSAFTFGQRWTAQLWSVKACQVHYSLAPLVRLSCEERHRMARIQQISIAMQISGVNKRKDQGKEMKEETKETINKMG